jgi:hypothetical protein
MSGASATTEQANLPASPPPIEPGVELGLVEWGNLALRAGRVNTNYPHMAWLLRFDEELTAQELKDEARRLGTNPYGFGRRLVSSRLPGGRMRWRQCDNVPPVEFNEHGVKDWRDWVEGKLGRRLDPEYDNGWAFIACTTAEGGTVVLVLMHHLFGTARGIMEACFDFDTHDPLNGSTGFFFTGEHNYTLVAELKGLVERAKLAFIGVKITLKALPQTLREAARKRFEPEDIEKLQPPKGEDPTRHPLSANRVYARFETTNDHLNAVAGEYGGSAYTLCTAIETNLLRRARIARQGPVDRRIQLVLPVDLPEEEKRAKLANRGSDPDAEDLLLTAAVVVEGGQPSRGDLTLLRARMKQSYIAAGEDSTAVRGATDIARLLPEGVTYRFAEKAALAFDGCVSNVGDLPENFLKLGGHVAGHAEMIGFPIGNEMIGAVTKCGGNVVLNFCTDPARMGPDTNLNQWLAEELAAWNLATPERNDQA